MASTWKAVAYSGVPVWHLLSRARWLKEIEADPEIQEHLRATVLAGKTRSSPLLSAITEGTRATTATVSLSQLGEPNLKSSVWSVPKSDANRVGMLIEVLGESWRDSQEGTEQEGTAPGDLELVKQLLASLILTVLQCATNEPTPIARGDIHRQFTELVARNFMQEHRVKWYAEQLSLSVRTLERDTMHALGVSPKHVLDERIVLEAMRLLAYSPLSVTAISRNLGFGHRNNFERFFQRAVGEYPTSFRNSILSSRFGLFS